MTRSRKQSHELMECANPECRRKLLVEGYRASVPETAPAERVHRVYRPNAPRQTVICSTCGHYTVSVDRPSEAMR
jgi:hypothetical protein